MDLTPSPNSGTASALGAKTVAGQQAWRFEQVKSSKAADHPSVAISNPKRARGTGARNRSFEDDDVARSRSTRPDKTWRTVASGIRRRAGVQRFKFNSSACR